MVGVGSRDHAEQVEVLEGGEDEKNELQTGEEARSLETFLVLVIVLRRLMMTLLSPLQSMPMPPLQRSSLIFQL